MHAGYGISLLAAGEPLRTAALSPFADISSVLLGLTFLLVAVGAILGLLVWSRNGNLALSGILLLPQSLMILLSGLTALRLALGGAYADGVERSFWFIFVDQLPVIMLMVFHTHAISRLLLRRRDDPI